MAFEFQFLDFLQTIHHPILDKLMIFFTTLGNAGILWILLAIIFLCVKKYRKCGVTMILTLVLGLIFGNIILKNIIGRERPCWINESVNMLIAIPKDYSFPSGHTLASIGAATAIFCSHKKLGIAAFAVAVVIAFSRMYLYVHFPTDILAGLILGIILGILSYILVNKFGPKEKAVTEK